MGFLGGSRRNLEEAESKTNGSPEYEVETSSSCSVDVYHKLQWNVTAVKVGSKKAPKTIIHNIVGGTETGELTAIMGPSGAGKTTLLECISLRNRFWEGGIEFDGKPTTGDFFTTSALVHQQELLFGFLKVEEHLSYHAITRMSHKFTTHQIQERIRQVLKETNLEKCENTLIGGTDPTFQKKGLSGGERKRLAIATELLLAPDVLFLDEPTSGLDSVMADSVINQMKELAENGRIVMASIHSPSSEMCLLFTHVLLLTGDGRLAFHGKSEEAALHFFTIGYPLPEEFNPSEFFLRLVSYKPNTKKEEEKARLDYIVEQFATSECHDSSPVAPTNAHQEFHNVHGVRISSFDLLKLNVWRGYLKTKRDLVSFGLWGAVAISIGFLFGALYFNQASNSWRNLIGLVFSLIVTMLLTASVSEMMHFSLEWGVIVREYYAGANAMGPYLMAKFFYELPMNYGPVLLATIVYWMTGMYPKFTEFLRFVGVMVLVNQASVSMGLMVSSVSRNPFVAMTALPAFICPMIMFSGILYQTSAIPPYLRFLEYFSIVNYGFSALLSLQLHILDPASQALTLAFTEIDISDLDKSIYMLCALSVLFYIGAYINLKLRIRLAAAT